MSDNPNAISDKPQAPPIDDSLQGSSLSDYRSGSTLLAKDAPVPPTTQSNLPDIELSAHLNHDEKGRLTSVQYADGTTMQCRYGTIGELTAVSTKDGGWWVKQEDNTFRLFDKNQHDTGKSMASLQLDEQNGAIVYYSHLEAPPGKATHLTDIVYPSGAKTSVDMNANGTRTERITFSSGDSETIHYDNQGHTDSITYGANNKRLAGVSWVKTGDTWTQYDDTGDTTGATWPKGTWVSTGGFLNSSDVGWVHFPDGSSDEQLLNGDVVRRDQSSWVTQITDSSGQTESFTYRNDGSVQTMTNKDGVTWTSIDGQWKQLDKKGKDTQAPISGFKSVAVAEDGQMKFVREYL
jgi:hypothetical protein